MTNEEKEKIVESLQKDISKCIDGVKRFLELPFTYYIGGLK